MTHYVYVDISDCEYDLFFCDLVNEDDIFIEEAYHMYRLQFTEEQALQLHGQMMSLLEEDLASWQKSIVNYFKKEIECQLPWISFPPSLF